MCVCVCMCVVYVRDNVIRYPLITFLNKKILNTGVIHLVYSSVQIPKKVYLTIVWHGLE